jgi:hypothetical protein
MKDVELLSSQVNWLTAHGNDAASWNQADFTDLDGCVFVADRRLYATYGGSDSSDQFARAEGLGDVVVSAGFERLYFLLFSISYRDHQYGQPGRKRSYAAQRFKATYSRHVDIKQNDIESTGSQLLNGLFTTRGFDYLKSEINQRRPQRPADRGLVIDEKNA